MSRKRVAGDTLTGGTKDVNPQFLTVRVTQTGADTATTGSFGVPIQRVGPNTQGKAIIMEVLKAFFNMPTNGVIGAAGETIDSVSAFWSTVDFGTTGTSWSEPRVFAGCQRQRVGAFTAAGTFADTEENGLIMQDLTDGAGHGILVATDNVFMQVISANGLTNQVDCKLLYRWKEVSLIEYIGIVQSQQ